MKTTPRQLTLVAGALFVVAFFLPAYAGIKGYACLCDCLWYLTPDPSSRAPDWRNGYFPAFIVTNLLFIAAFAIGLKTERFFRARFLVTLVASLHVLSWPILMLTYPNGEDDMPDTPQIGYFVWLLAFALLLAAQLLERRRAR